MDMTRFIQFGWQKLARCFVAGLLAILPLVLTIAIVSWVVTFLRDIFGPGTPVGRMLAGIGVRLFTESRIAPGGEVVLKETLGGYALGIILVLLVLFALGVFVEFGAKRYFKALVDRLIRHIPIIGGLYGSLTQVVDLFDQNDQAEIKAMSVVYCSFAGGGGTGALALMPSPEKIMINDEAFHVVIIPTAPVPFGGALVFFPAEQVKPANMSVDNFISIYVSMGVTTPEFMNAAKPKA